MEPKYLCRFDRKQSRSRETAGKTNRRITPHDSKPFQLAQFYVDWKAGDCDDDHETIAFFEHIFVLGAHGVGHQKRTCEGGMRR
jgi:hypothetical protein